MVFDYRCVMLTTKVCCLMVLTTKDCCLMVLTGVDIKASDVTGDGDGGTPPA